MIHCTFRATERDWFHKNGKIGRSQKNATEYLFNYDMYVYDDICIIYMIWLYMCPSQTVNGWHAYEDIPNHSGYQLEARTSGSIDVHWIRCDWAKHRIHVCSAAPQTSPRTHGDRITASSAAGIELWMHLLLQNVMLWTAKMSHFVCSHTIQGTPPIVIIQYLNGIPPF